MIRLSPAYLVAGFVVIATTPALGQQRSAYEELQTFSAVLSYVRLNYPDSVSYSELVGAAIRGVLSALDAHSHYVSRSDFEKRAALEAGRLFSVGLTLENVEGVITVWAVAPRSSAEKAGLQAGDRLLMLNDTSVAGWDAQDIGLRLVGEEDSKVKLRLERGPRFDPDTFSVTLKRKPFEQHSVSIARMADSSTGFLRLEVFLDNAAKEVHDALKRLRSSGARQFILDVRGNPGGEVLSAVDVTSEFLPKGTVLFRTKGRKRSFDTTFVSQRDGDFRDVPLIVLIDERSASAAEALSATLQDHDRALLVGRRSFGKALMQTVFLLPSGDYVWLTVGRVVTPSGRVVQRRYRGISYEQYLSLAGSSGAEQDTLAVFHTDAGRVVRGGGGILPDINVPVTAPLPVWWSIAADSGLAEAVADSVALTLPATPAARAAWLTGESQWRATIIPPFLARVRNRLGVSAATDSLLERRLAGMLAARVAEVRWGSDARDAFVLRHDRTVRVAIEQFPRLPELLGRD